MRGGLLLGLLALALAGVVAGGRGASDFRAVEPLAAAMRRFDANHDGVLSRDEYARYGRASDFDRYDANHDGLLDAAEYRAAFLGQEPDPGDLDPLLRLPGTVHP